MITRNADRPRTAGRLAGLILALVALLANAGAGVAQEGTDEQKQDESSSARDAAPIVVTVENNNWSDMRIYGLRDGVRYRLGTVTSFTKARFELPRQLQAEIKPVQLLADPIAGTRSVRSYPVYLSPTDEVVWVLQNNLALSGVVLN